MLRHFSTCSERRAVPDRLSWSYTACDWAESFSARLAFIMPLVCGAGRGGNSAFDILVDVVISVFNWLGQLGGKTSSE